MRRIWLWHAICLKAGVMRKLFRFRSEIRRKIFRNGLLGCALLLALAIPAPRGNYFEPKLFTVVGEDFISPLIGSALGIQALNARLDSMAHFVGYDQITTLASAGSTREFANVTRYSGEVFALVRAEFLVRSEPGAEHHLIYISEGYWKRVLGQTPDVLGRAIETCGETFQIGGVVHTRSSFLGDTELWIPVNSRGMYGNMTALRVIGVLQPGANWSASEKEVRAALKSDSIAEQIIQAGAIHLLPFERKLITYAAEKGRTNPGLQQFSSGFVQHPGRSGGIFARALKWLV